MNELDQIDVYMNQIIDEIHPMFKSISDETMISDNADHGVFSRDFIHNNGKKFRMEWSVYYGTPETVQTIFEPAIELI